VDVIRSLVDQDSRRAGGQQAVCSQALQRTFHLVLQPTAITCRAIALRTLRPDLITFVGRSPATYGECEVWRVEELSAPWWAVVVGVIVSPAPCYIDSLSHATGVSRPGLTKENHLPVYADFVFGRPGGGGGGETPILGVRIASVLPNPEGEDQGKESVALTNQGTTSIDLTGWKLRDRAGGEASLSDQLAAGASKTVILPRSLALNNNGDEVALIGSDGIERHRISYSLNQVLPGQEIDF
jgi:hypothetical protein